MANRPIITVTKWPGGLGLEFEDHDGEGGTGIGGACGGGIGTKQYSFAVNLPRLKQAIKEWEDQDINYGR